MASTSGTKGPFEIGRQPSKRMVRAPTRNVDLGNEEGVVDSEIVPSSLAVLVPILRAALEIEEENPRVAYLCRFHAFEKAHTMDPTSSGRGVRQFKTYLLHKLEKEGELTERLVQRSDARELQTYYQQFYEKKIRDGEFSQRPEEMAKNVQIATVLYEVLKTMVAPQNIEEKTKRYAEDVEHKRGQYEHYNILPLYAVGVKPAIMELPEIKAAISALCKVDNLPMPIIRARPDASNEDSTMPTERLKKVNDILDWIASVFGFQKGNVANQREHLILLLANLNIRDRVESSSQLHVETVEKLMGTIFKNYESWCHYVRCESNLRFLEDYDLQQIELIYIALYLLIWGEASNIRFMPECICYIFHHMCHEVYRILDKNPSRVTGSTEIVEGRDDEYFLREVISPIYQVLMKEAKRNNKGKASHSNWRNYDDLNEYFWSKKCFDDLKWPWDPKADFFRHSDETQTRHRRRSQANTGVGKRKPKTNFVEVRTFLHLYRSFDRMWIFFILALQAMIIIGWSSLGPVGVFFEEDVFRNVMTIFITYAFLNFLQVTLDIILTWNALKNMKFTQLLRYFLKFVVAAVWVVVLPVCYSSSLVNPSGLIKFVTSWAGDWGNQSLYTYVVVLYMLPNIAATILFFLPPLRRKLERSNMRILTFLMWWAQPKLYVGRGMHENMFSLLKYTLFWIMLLISKLAFSYYVEILPLIGPTKLIMGMSIDNYQWHEFFPENETHNICIVIAIWAPIILVYFMDTQIWYAIYATLFGGIIGAFSHLGEIRTLGMLRSRFQSVPVAFSQRFWTGRDRKTKQEESDETYERNNIAYFSQVWNEFINSMREEDLISNRDRDLLLVPYSASYVSVIQWPPFLLASKIPIAVDMAKDYKKETDDDLFRKIKNDGYMYSAVVECYETLKDIILNLLLEEEDRLVVSSICGKVEQCILDETFVKEFNMSGLPSLSEKLEKFLTLLRSEDGKLESQIVNVLQDIVEIIIQDVMVDGHLFLQTPQQYHLERGQRFVSIDTSFTHNRAVMEKVIRLHLLLTVKESAINVPQNIEARRRITFFANSLFMNMPKAPKVRDMLSFSVLTPYFKEDVLYSDEELNKENEDGISILFYLTKIYPDEWANFHERLKSEDIEEDKEELMRQWASYRGQTLYRTVRGMMYYWQALILQCFIESAGDNALSEGFRTMYSYDTNKKLLEDAQAMADLKFTYVVSCQVYGSQKKSKNTRDRSCYNNILNLMLMYSALRVAYIDETEETKDGKSQKVYYSVLVKGGDKYDEEIYRIKLPGPPTEIGEGKPENQNHAIIFTRGEALQTIDMNQDNYYEEAFKMRNVLEEFRKRRSGRRKPTILGIREHIFTGSVSSLAWFMSNQETSFVTIGQRILANPLRVRFHYGHPDIFDRIFHITRGGISKASKVINLSEDIFAGFNSTLRQGFITHHEYIQVGKGRDVGMNQISLFEAKVANGNGEQSLSRDVYRLGRRFDFYRMLSFYFTTVGFYFSSMITVLTVYVFLYGRLYMVLSGVEREILQSPNIHQSKALEEALATQSVVQLGLLLVLPMVMEIGLEKGFRTALGDFIIMQLQLASVFFTFQLGTKAHYYGRTLLHGGSKYRPTGRGFVVFHAKFAENYRMYSRSHFVKGLEILILLIVYEVYGESYRSSHLYLFITISMWFLATSWLFAPFLFNPSGFDWQKTVDDWTDWKRWMGNRGGIGISADKSWESWWDEENEHMKHSNIRGKILEIILAFRFFMYQYGIVYHMDITHHHKELLVFGLSWAVLIIILIVLKMVSMGRRRFGTDFQLMFRILKALLFLGFLSVMTVLFVVCGLTISDLFAAIIAFMPSGWAIILIAQACKVCLKGAKLWDSVKELSRAYEYVMGLIIFLPTAILSWFPFVSEFQTRLLFNQAFSRGLQISMILAGKKDTYKSD
ncbi:callose synthase 7-like [Vigna unguiculata]|uniref:1,3-beta-glucan synthase n=1 Tax=Vigna unguiculata TaxID=3917 RepID=A0A4D6KSB4_VIGUN|nr:callose synthase 7-like [Vigna unguiculata]XP_027931975.1 callose synthase 7-like [Vigna unguiculata]QCD79590.1 callose synthase [Vigna unguiculata]